MEWWKTLGMGKIVTGNLLRVYRGSESAECKRMRTSLSPKTSIEFLF